MPRFEFRLERIRELRKREEESCGRELAILLGRRSELQARVEALVRQKLELSGRRAELQRNAIDIAAVAENRLQIDATSRGEAILRGRLPDLDREIAAKRRELLDRSRKRKALDKLRERRWEEFRLDENRRELKEADDRPRRPRGMGIA